jgi:hypothetical protein
MSDNDAAPHRLTGAKLLTRSKTYTIRGIEQGLAGGRRDGAFTSKGSG